MGGKGPDTHETRQISEPPAYLKPYLERALSGAEGLYNTRPLYASGPPGAVGEGYGAAMDAARNPELIPGATDLASRTIGGEFLGADALRNAARSELDAVVGGTQSAFEQAGRGGSPAAMRELGRGVTAALGPAYARERGLQQQAMGMSPQLEQARFMPGESLARLGMAEQGVYDRYHQEPWDRLARYSGIGFGNAPGSMMGGTTTGQQPIYQPSPFQQILGLGMAGAGMASGLGWRPF